MSGFEDLPIELITYILTYSGPTSWYICTLVAKRMRSTALKLLESRHGPRIPDNPWGGFYVSLVKTAVLEDHRSLLSYVHRESPATIGYELAKLAVLHSRTATAMHLQKLVGKDRSILTIVQGYDPYPGSQDYENLKNRSVLYEAGMSGNLDTIVWITSQIKPKYREC
jgi:hypothetical protein